MAIQKQSHKNALYDSLGPTGPNHGFSGFLTVLPRLTPKEHFEKR